MKFSLGGLSFSFWINTNFLTILTKAFKLYHTFDNRKNGIITAHAYIQTWMPTSALLTDNDIAGNDGFTAELLYAAKLWIRVATIASAT